MRTFDALAGLGISPKLLWQLSENLYQVLLSRIANLRSAKTGVLLFR
jgi:hypothetical protein